jgi:hypothetical protein
MKQETVEIIEIQGEYHLKPENEFYRLHTTHTIPKWLFDLYVERRRLLEDIKLRIKLKFHPVKDKRMRVKKNHTIIKENEIHHFDEDGTITIIN